MENNRMKLWYDHPAKEWTQTLPIGNGSLGGMIFGGIKKEKIGLNEESLWSGYYKDKNNPNAYAGLMEARKLVFSGKYREAEEVIRKNMLGEFNESYLPLGNLVFSFSNGEEEHIPYKRELDIDQSIAKVCYEDAKGSYSREYFASFPAKAILIRMTAERGELSFGVSYESFLKHSILEAGNVESSKIPGEGETDKSLAEEKALPPEDRKTGITWPVAEGCYEIKCPEHVDPSYVGDREGNVIQGSKGKKEKLWIRVLFCDGEVTFSAKSGSEKGACEAEEGKSRETGNKARDIGDNGECSGEAHTERKETLDADGTLYSLGEILQIAHAKECILMVSAVQDAQNWQKKSYQELKDEHIRDYKRLYDRTELFLGEQKEEPTDVRLQKLKEGEADNGLYALFFQYGRYLLISSSREGGVPANLQGIWSWDFRAPWSSNYTVNINTQMNYWPALSCNLEECLEPYYRFMEKVCEEGQKTARINYHCRGFVAHHNIDGWYNTNPVGCLPGEKEGEKGSVGWAFWPMGGAWLTQQLWRAYEYNKGKAFLEEKAFPVIREAAAFLNDWLVLQEGYYVTCPSTSPENQHLTENGESTGICMASTMDMTIVREVFDYYEKACAELGICETEGIASSDGRMQEKQETEGVLKESVPHETVQEAVPSEIVQKESVQKETISPATLLAEIKEKKKQLFPYQTGKYGQLLEWNEDFPESEPGHRHISHLYGLFPGELFEEEEALKESCRISLMRRLENGSGHTGWSCAWIINVFAILGDQQKAYEYLKVLLTRSTYPNLWDAHPPFQIDGNFGGTAGIANMLVQDRGGKVKVLPALPKEWKDGYVKGLRIKDGKQIDITWKDGRVIEKEIY